MNDGSEFHLTLQQFPSALIVLGKQQSLHTIAEIVPHSSAGIISFIILTMLELFLSSLSRTMKLFEVFLEICTDECSECNAKQRRAREASSGSTPLSWNEYFSLCLLHHKAQPEPPAHPRPVFSHISCMSICYLLAGLPLWSRLKYLNNYCMDYYTNHFIPSFVLLC